MNIAEHCGLYVRSLDVQYHNDGMSRARQVATLSRPPLRQLRLNLWRSEGTSQWMCGNARLGECCGQQLVRQPKQVDCPMQSRSGSSAAVACPLGCQRRATRWGLRLRRLRVAERLRRNSKMAMAPGTMHPVHPRSGFSASEAVDRRLVKGVERAHEQ